MTSIYRIWIILGILIIAFESVAECPDKQNVKIYNTQRIFFKESGTGTMARLPNVTSQRQVKAEHRYEAFEQSGTYNLEGRVRDVWFLINHRVGRETDAASYVGVMVAKVLKTELASTLGLYRNQSWFSLQDEGTELSSFQYMFKSAQLFFSIHKNDSEGVESFNQEFKNWHALANKNPKLPSWDRRGEWSGYNLDCLKDISGDDNLNSSQIFIQARLLRFVPTTKYEPGSPVAWDIALGDAKAVYIKLFSPMGSGFTREYYIGLSHR